MARNESGPVGEPGNTAPLPRRVGAEAGSTWLVVLVNLAVLALAWWQHWSLILLFFPYWVQSVFIGIFSFRRMRLVGSRETAQFFAMHYGIFHLTYLGFITISLGKGELPNKVPVPPMTENDIVWLALASLAFAVTHYLSYRRNLERDRRGAPSTERLMLIPYARVIPMHLTLIVGLAMGYTGALLLFGLLKTAVDVLAHLAEHRWLAST
jgi:hypothetical protein